MRAGHCVNLYSVLMHICRLRNDLYCVEWDVKLYYTIPCISDYESILRNFQYL